VYQSKCTEVALAADKTLCECLTRAKAIPFVLFLFITICLCKLFAVIIHAPLAAKELHRACCNKKASGAVFLVL
jgi:hypothetical protein